MIGKMSSKRRGVEVHQAPRLEHVFIKLNERCNARCPFCSCWTVEDTPPAIDVLQLAEALAELAPNEVNLSGGEVILFPRFWELLEAGKKQVRWSITTNGSVVAPQGALDRLVELGVRRLFFSIDSHEPALHDANRRTPGMFQRMATAMRAARSAASGPEIIVNHVVTRTNAEHVVPFVEAMIEAGAAGINLIPVKDTPDLYLSEASIARYCAAVEGALREERIDRHWFVNGIWEIFGTTAAEHRASAGGSYPVGRRQGCAIPSATAFIDCATGDVFPCDTTYWRRDPRYVVGNLRSASLRSVWEGEPFRRFRAAMFPEIGHPCFRQCDPNNVFPADVTAAAACREGNAGPRSGDETEGSRP